MKPIFVVVVVFYIFGMLLFWDKQRNPIVSVFFPLLLPVALAALCVLVIVEFLLTLIAPPPDRNRGGDNDSA